MKRACLCKIGKDVKRREEKENIFIIEQNGRVLKIAKKLMKDG